MKGELKEQCVCSLRLSALAQALAPVWEIECCFWNEQQLCHLHTLILGSTGGIIICQTCLHNEELSREISWRSVAINVRVLPRHFYAAPNPLLSSLPTYSHSLKTWSPCKSPLEQHCWMELNVPCSLRRFSDSLTPFKSSPAHSAQGLCYANDLLPP